MGLVTGTEVLEPAHRGRYAVGAFNINNLEILQGVLAGCTETQSPVIIAVTEGAITYAGFDYIVAMVKAAAELAPYPWSCTAIMGVIRRLSAAAYRAGSPR